MARNHVHRRSTEHSRSGQRRLCAIFKPIETDVALNVIIAPADAQQAARASEDEKQDQE